ncbi:MAG TPA: PQQ-dependent sugar dehydrogenase [Actinophytocola sp.]|nr:PQQ-dependent sugar dehydrogenase [Actinophytocola sp.]
MSRATLRRRLSRAIPVAAISLLWPLLPPTSPAAATPHHVVPLDELRVRTTQVATLSRPTSIAPLPDGRLLITEKSGTVRAYHPETGLAPRPVLDLRDRVSETENERGLLGIAVPRNFWWSGVVYVAYTRESDEAVTLSRIRLRDGAERVILAQPHATFGNHNGGHLEFGKDGFLYLGIGDGGSGGDPFNAGQDRDTWLGKILRIDVSRSCGHRPYCVPRDNPFVGVPGTKPEIWSWGLRNPWGFSFDPADGSLWIGDVGQGRFEEINHIGRHQGGANFGWSCMEGPAVFDETRCDPDADYTAPVFHYRSGTEGCSVIGGRVYRGERFAELAAGTYVASDYCSNTAFAVRANRDGTHTSGRIGTFPPFATAFGVDRAGELYMVNDDFNEDRGGLHAITFEHLPSATSS